METYNLAKITKAVYDSELKLFTTTSLRNITEINKESSLFNLISRLIKNNIFIKIERGKYQLAKAVVHEFEIANFLYDASYISFESALNFYGILSQFPYEITSATSKKTIDKKFQNKVFAYTHIKKELFWGIEKKNNFLIASPEKTLLDQLYLTSKGIKAINLDEYDLSKINKTKLKQDLKKFPQTTNFKKLLESVL
ncbi:hypothetical protein KKD61_04385 [Patescibacteria group bacterium]|nr:hypothetical protein [Patescibacteria group bacterium]